MIENRSQPIEEWQMLALGKAVRFIENDFGRRQKSELIENYRY